MMKNMTATTEPKDKPIEELKALRERVAGLTGPDREVDLALGALWPGSRPFNMSLKTMRNMLPPVFAFTASIDAALALVEKALPGYSAHLRTGDPGLGFGNSEHWPGATLRPHLFNDDGWKTGAKAATHRHSLALAIILALLDARLAEEE